VSDSRPSRTVAVDTMTLVWGIKQVGHREYLLRARWLFEELDRDDARIIVPAVVVAEYLTTVPEHLRMGVLTKFTRRFFVAPFDAKCPPLSARLWQKGRKTRAGRNPGERKCLRADTLIIATACVHGAREFYSGDAKCRKLAEGLMDPKDLPDIAPDLFAGANGER